MSLLLVVVRLQVLQTIQRDLFETVAIYRVLQVVCVFYTL